MNKTNKVISILLVFLIMLGIATVCAAEETEGITVFLSISQYGEIVQGKNGETLANTPMILTEQDTYNLDDLFREAHNLYYPEEREGYASSESKWGFGIDMFWGDASGNFGYQVNGGTESLMGLDYILKNGDYVDVCIYRNLYPDTERYATFDKHAETVYAKERHSFTLTYVSGYDEDGNMVFSPCSEAIVTVNGEETDILTDEKGVMTLCIDQVGTYIISAKKEKILNEKTVPAITAPVLILTVQEHPAVDVIHGIAQAYTETTLESLGGNLPWVLADMAVYEALFPQNNIAFSDEQKQEAIHVLMPSIKEAEKPGDLAKYILALRALGYDARNIYTDEFEKIDIVEKLVNSIEQEDEAVTNIYTLPYVLTALMQEEGYAEEAHLQYLITAALSKKESWQDISQGTDALCPMITALAPFAEESEEITAVLAESLDILKQEQREDGLMDGFEGYEPASTGLAMCSVSALGENAADIKTEGASLVDGLLSVVNEEQNGFPNAFATEQGFRGLLSWVKFLQKEARHIYDFKGYPAEELNVSGIAYCPIVFEVSPETAQIWVEGYDAITDHTYDLPEGKYYYQVSASGYQEENGTIQVSARAEREHILKTISVTLTKKSSGGPGGPSNRKPSKEEPGTPQQDTTDIPKKEIFQDVKEGDWFYNAVHYVHNMGLFQGTHHGFDPNGNMTRGMVATVLCRLASGEQSVEKTSFSDITSDSWYVEGISWCVANNIMQGIGNNLFAPNASLTREQLATVLYRYALYLKADMPTSEHPLGDEYKDADQISSYAKEAFGFTVHTGIISGKGNGILAPRDYATRAEVAAMLMRFVEVVK